MDTAQDKTKTRPRWGAEVTRPWVYHECTSSWAARAHLERGEGAPWGRSRCGREFRSRSKPGQARTLLGRQAAAESRATGSLGLREIGRKPAGSLLNWR